jgi:hypothetical protein
MASELEELDRRRISTGDADGRPKGRRAVVNRERTRRRAADARARRRSARFHEEGAIGKAYDARLLRRLWPFVRRTPRSSVVSLGTLVVIAGINLVRPSHGRRRAPGRRARRARSCARRPRARGCSSSSRSRSRSCRCTRCRSPARARWPTSARDIFRSSAAAAPLLRPHAGRAPRDARDQRRRRGERALRVRGAQRDGRLSSLVGHRRDDARPRLAPVDRRVRGAAARRAHRQLRPQALARGLPRRPRQDRAPERVPQRAGQRHRRRAGVRARGAMATSSTTSTRLPRREQALHLLRGAPRRGDRDGRARCASPASSGSPASAASATTRHVRAAGDVHAVHPSVLRAGQPALAALHDASERDGGAERIFELLDEKDVAPVAGAAEAASPGPPTRPSRSSTSTSSTSRACRCCAT